MSVPIFNPSLPGNQAAVSQGIELTKCGGNCNSAKKPWISDETLKYWGIPTNKLELAKCLSNQSDYFATTSILTGSIGVTAPMTPIFSITSMIADAGSKMFNPQPAADMITDAALDIIESKIPEGYIKDVSFYPSRKVYSDYRSSKNETTESCKN